MLQVQPHNNNKVILRSEWREKEKEFTYASEAFMLRWSETRIRKKKNQSSM